MVIVAILVPLLVVGIVWLMYTSASQPEGAFQTPSETPSACRLLSQAQVDAYLPGAVADGNGGAYSCRWSPPVGAKGEPGQLTVGVATLPGDRPKVSDAKEEYSMRRAQIDESGMAITPLSIGDESFMACAAPNGGDPESCTTYTRVSNVVLSLNFESYAVADTRDLASSVEALTTQAFQRLGQSS